MSFPVSSTRLTHYGAPKVSCGLCDVLLPFLTPHYIFPHRPNNCNVTLIQVCSVSVSLWSFMESAPCKQNVDWYSKGIRSEFWNRALLQDRTSRQNLSAVLKPLSFSFILWFSGVNYLICLQLIKLWSEDLQGVWGSWRAPGVNVFVPQLCLRVIQRTLYCN